MRIRHRCVEIGELPVERHAHGIVKQQALPVAAATAQPREQTADIADTVRQADVFRRAAEQVDELREVQYFCHGAF